MSPVEELREAARQLRERAEKATPGPWTREWAFSTHFVVPENANDVASGNVSRLKTSQRGDAEYIASMHPGVGQLLAAWWDCVAIDQEETGLPESPAKARECSTALHLARTYLGKSTEGGAR